MIKDSMTQHKHTCGDRLIPFAQRQGIWFCRTCNHTVKVKARPEPEVKQLRLWGNGQ